MIGFSVMLMYASYLGNLADAMKANALTLDQIRQGQQTTNPVIATRNNLVKDFVENNKDFKQIESIYKQLGRYNEMTENEFLDGLFPNPDPSDGTPQTPSRQRADGKAAHGASREP
jgi:hypothetical protein